MRAERRSRRLSWAKRLMAAHELLSPKPCCLGSRLSLLAFIAEGILLRWFVFVGPHVAWVTRTHPADMCEY